jgi:hypothetical protein
MINPLRRTKWNEQIWNEYREHIVSFVAFRSKMVVNKGRLLDCYHKMTSLLCASLLHNKFLGDLHLIHSSMNGYMGGSACTLEAVLRSIEQ